MTQCERSPVDNIVRLRQYPSAAKTDLTQSPNLFVYCSTPRPVLEMEVTGGSYGRPLYRDSTEKPVGMHSYYNISWDPRVRRGDPLQTRKIREQIECEKIRRKLLEPRKKTSKTDSKTAKDQIRSSDPQAMIRVANMRYARLAISNLRPKEKDAFMVELTDELDQDEVCYKGQRIGAAKVLPKVPSRKRNLVDQACQVWPADFSNFDRDIVPVIERLVGAVCYQARLEVLEEAELEALRLERELFAEQKRKEEFELRKFKTRVEKHIAEEQRQVALAEKQLRDEIEGKTSVSLFAGVYVKYDTEEGWNALGEEWQQNARIRKAVEGEVKSWLSEEAEQKMNQHKLSNRLLDDIIQHVVSEREAQCAAAMWKEVYREEPLRLVSQEIDPNLVPPPTPGTSMYASEEEDGQYYADPGSDL